MGEEGGGGSVTARQHGRWYHYIYMQKVAYNTLVRWDSHGDGGQHVASQRSQRLVAVHPHGELVRVHRGLIGRKGGHKQGVLPWLVDDGLARDLTRGRTAAQCTTTWHTHMHIARMIAPPAFGQSHKDKETASA